MINIDDLTTTLVSNLITFAAGVLFADPIKSKLNEWHRLIVLRRRKAIPVRVFFIRCPFCSDQLRQLLMRQNKLQTMFQLEIAPWERWRGRTASEETLEALSAAMAIRVANSSGREETLKALLEFCEKFQEEMCKCIPESTQGDHNVLNIAITQLPFPANFYTWNTRDRKGIVIGIDSLHRLFQEDQEVVNKIILRVVQRMLVYSLRMKNLKAHEASRGCLFDFTRQLAEIQYSVDHTFLCDECRPIILQDKANLRVFDSINEWLMNTRSSGK
jgi:hypothetical protein